MAAITAIGLLGALGWLLCFAALSRVRGLLSQQEAIIDICLGAMARAGTEETDTLREILETLDMDEEI